MLIIFLVGYNVEGFGQDAKYRLSPYPDIWYNDVDGIRLGLRVIGEMEGTFKDGPHRLDAGVWLGTWLPENPVSYYVSFTEPIPAISSYMNEGSVQVESLIRTGISKHGLYFNKRWQSTFNESKYLNIQIGSYAQKHFDEQYRQFGDYWLLHPDVFRFAMDYEENRKELQDWMYFININSDYNTSNTFGRFQANMEFLYQVEGVSPFYKIDLELIQIVNISNSFKLRIRSFSGLADENTPYHYSYLKGNASLIDWLDNGFVRAEGTLPIKAFDEALFQVSGGPNLRGYRDRDFQYLSYQSFPTAVGADNYFMTLVSSLNFDLEYPNPVNTLIQEKSVVSDLMEFRSYLFYDIGFYSSERGESLGQISSDFKRTLDESISNFGTGFQLSINIPDYLGKDRGIFIRYDIPFWLSHPEGNDPNFKYRHLVGIGAIFSF